MLKKIFLLCFLLSGFIFSQQYTNEKYEKYVGTKLGKYPLTVTGLKKAIAALDSGIVYIAYPGLWDTTGLGVIPDEIVLSGWLFGNYVSSIPKVKSNFLSKMVFSQTSSVPVPDAIKNDYAPFQFYGRQFSWWPILRVSNILDKHTPYVTKHASSRYHTIDLSTIIDTSYNSTWNSLSTKISNVGVIGDSNTYNASGGVVITDNTNIFYNQLYQPNSLNTLRLNDNFIDYGNNIDTVWVTGGIIHNYARIGTIGTGVYFNADYYLFRSEPGNTISARLLTGKTCYHFYGAGNYPSYFGGTVNSSAGYNYSADTSSTDAYKIVLAGAHTLIAGLEVTFKVTNANTDGATLTVNSLTAKALTKAASGAVNTALATGDILAGQIVKAVYDGTQFQIISRLAQ